MTRSPLARHGIAHQFLLKGSLQVRKGQPAHHLTLQQPATYCIDASKFADDLVASYTSRVLPYIEVAGGQVDPAKMEARRDFLDKEYDKQAAKIIADNGPQVAAPVTATFTPDGPSGPHSSRFGMTKGYTAPPVSKSDTSSSQA